MVWAASGDHDGVLRNGPTWISDGKFGVANPHTVRFFYANRSAAEAVFRLRTDVELSGSTPARCEISGGFD